MSFLSRGFAASCLALALAGTTLSGAAQAADVTVFAAASLKSALDDFQKSYEKASGDHLQISYAGSSQLAKQIEAGAPAEVFISASPDWMDEVEKQGMIEAGSRHDLLGNALVLVSHAPAAAPAEIDASTDLPGLLGGGKLAMALVDSVPAGVYGKASLTSLGMWDKVAPSVAQADNVRAALALVSTGEAPYGIVYATDAAADDKVSVAGIFPEDSHPPIIYPAGLVKGAGAPAAAFLKALGGAEARAVFEKQGFTVLAKPE